MPATASTAQNSTTTQSSGPRKPPVAAGVPPSLVKSWPQASQNWASSSRPSPQTGQVAGRLATDVSSVTAGGGGAGLGDGVGSTQRSSFGDGPGLCRGTGLGGVT